MNPSQDFKEKIKNIANIKNETNGYDFSRRSLFSQDNHDLVPIVSSLV